MNMLDFISARVRATRLLVRQYRTTKSGEWLFRFPHFSPIKRINPQARIFVVSLPRSGSSWIGKTLSQAPASLYLREPISQSFRYIDLAASPVYEHSACRYKYELNQLALRAFRAIPLFNGVIVQDRVRWKTQKETRSLIIKEVNPLIIDWIHARFRPQIVYLVRHPAAVALSIRARGWGGRDPFENIFTPERFREIQNRFIIPDPEDYWARHGAYQAICQRLALEALEEVPEHTVVVYEDICHDPLQGFQSLFEVCQLEFDSNTQQSIIQNTNAQLLQADPEPYGTARASKGMIDRWRSQICVDELASLKSGYLANDPHYYRDSSDW